MRRSRLALMSVGAVLGIALVAVVGLVWQPKPAPHIHKSTLADCTQSPQIAVEWFCGKYLVYVNPDGSHVRMKVTKPIAVSVHPEAPTP